MPYRNLRFRFALLVCGLLFLWPEKCHSEPPRSLVHLEIDHESLRGRIAAADDHVGWLMGRDGRLTRFTIDDVTEFNEVDPKFVPMSMMDVRDRLQEEFGRNYEVKTTSHYVVVASRQCADRYARLFEKVYRQCVTYFGSRGLRIVDPEFPLVAIVLPDESSFAKYCRDEGGSPQSGMVGYYLTSSNRVALYDRVRSGNGSDSDVDDTVIHEATHQVAFNTGIHSRIGQNPLWLVEGLATLLEADGVRSKQVGAESIDRVNRERFGWFISYRSKRRASNSIESFVGDDNLFRRSPLDAYSQAWAMTFYLVERRPADFAHYLKTIASHDPFLRYDAETRLQEFRDSFGKDLDQFERDFLRFLGQLEQQNQ